MDEKLRGGKPSHLEVGTVYQLLWEPQLFFSAVRSTSKGRPVWLIDRATRDIYDALYKSTHHDHYLSDCELQPVLYYTSLTVFILTFFILCWFDPFSLVLPCLRRVTHARRACERSVSVAAENRVERAWQKTVEREAAERERSG